MQDCWVDMTIVPQSMYNSFVEIKTKTRKFMVGEVYRVPGTSEPDFLEKYESIISKIKEENENNRNYIVGNTMRQ